MLVSAYRYVRPGSGRGGLPGASGVGADADTGQNAGPVASNLVANRHGPVTSGARHRLPALRFLRTESVARVILLAAIAAAGGGSCGSVTFVDAPFAPRKIDVVYSMQEDITALRWHMGATEIDGAVRFELLDAAGVWQPIDFASSV